MKLCNMCGIELTAENCSKSTFLGKNIRRCRKCRTAVGREYDKNHPRSKESWRWNNVASRHGLTKDKVIKILEQQKGLCPICEESLSIEGRGGRCISIDHNHNCCPGRRSCDKCFRGLLHKSCNAGMGQFRDDPRLLLNAMNYLQGVVIIRL